MKQSEGAGDKVRERHSAYMYIIHIYKTYTSFRGFEDKRNRNEYEKSVHLT